MITLLVMSTSPCMELGNQLCFQLYAVSRMVTQVYAPLLEALDLTYPQYLVLVALWKEDGLSVSEIGRQLYLDSGTLTPLLKRMEAKQLLSRKRSKEDGREVVVHLARQGQSLRNKGTQLPTLLRSRMALSEKERCALQSSLKKAIDVLSQSDMICAAV